VDGKPLDAAQLSSLRGQTSWIDPAVQLWAQSLFDNINFSADPGAEKALPVALSRADLLEVIEQLPEGMQSELGEGGARLSGGQGQRVRLGRALLRRDARLVLLDEPFRGLERARRRELMARIRAHWPRATILFISHDIEDTLDFDCVFVLENGRLVEHGSPRRLVGDGGSRYFRHLEAERALRSEMWSDRHWQRRSIREGRLVTVLRNDEREESPA
jgi:ATP-binding cassette subfamily B protein